MNRRTFLHLLSAGAFGAMTLDVEKLLWVPGAKTIFLPPVKVPHAILTVDMITREALRILERDLKFGTLTARHYKRGKKIGDTVTAQNSFTAILSDQVGVNVPMPEPGMSLDAYSECVLKPAVASMARRVNAVGPTVFGELDLPKGCVEATRITSDTASIRGAVEYDFGTNATLLRLDTLVGGS